MDSFKSELERKRDLEKLEENTKVLEGVKTAKKSSGEGFYRKTSRKGNLYWANKLNFEKACDETYDTESVLCFPLKDNSSSPNSSTQNLATVIETGHLSDSEEPSFDSILPQNVNFNFKELFPAKEMGDLPEKNSGKSQKSSTGFGDVSKGENFSFKNLLSDQSSMISQNSEDLNMFKKFGISQTCAKDKTELGRTSGILSKFDEEEFEGYGIELKSSNFFSKTGGGSKIAKQKTRVRGRKGRKAKK